MTTAIYSALHFLVDLACAHAMFRYFSQGAQGYEAILIYNFCAFALQMPLGTLLDQMENQTRPRIYVGAGLVCTALGMFLHPALLGLGNALFHVGGGVGVIRQDCRRSWRGQALGIFVAPGALGLFLGGQMAGLDLRWIITGALMLALVPLCLLADEPAIPSPKKHSSSGLLPGVCCFLVVALRSYVGLAVGFSWKQGFLMGLLAVCAVVLGKAAGGFAAARFGQRRSVMLSLVLAAGCYLLGEQPLFGIAGLFFFNMSMPITLYQLWLRNQTIPGFSFGALTFALFLGFLPVYAGWSVPVPGGVLGAMGSVVSLGLLLPVCEKEDVWTST